MFSSAVPGDRGSGVSACPSLLAASPDTPTNQRENKVFPVLHASFSWQKE